MPEVLWIPKKHKYQQQYWKYFWRNFVYRKNINIASNITTPNNITFLISSHGVSKSEALKFFIISTPDLSAPTHH
jgi:hypothetical protein